MRVSVITVVLNNQAYVKDAIASVLSQTYRDIEYIVIDGGSTDGSLQIIHSFKDRISRVVSEPDEGIYDAMNKGLSLATGDVIGFLNADDFYVHPHVIEHVADAFKRVEVEALYADLDYVSRNDKQKVLREWRSGVYDKSSFYKGWMPPHPTFFARREIYQRYGGYNTQLVSTADYELMLRFLLLHDVRADYLREVIVKMRVGGQSNRTLLNRIKANLEDRKAWKMNHIRPRWYTMFLKPLSKITQFRF